MSINLGGRKRKKDYRDISLGKVQAPVSIPPVFLPDNSWLKRNFQGQLPFCGTHAGTHLKMILDHQVGIDSRKTPRFGAVEMKDPLSPVYDTYAIDAGTDMRSVFQWLQKVGADDFEPLENDVTLPIQNYCDPKSVSADMVANAKQSQIDSYAFHDTDFQSICQSTFQNKAVLLLIKCDDGLWGTNQPTFTTPKYGHFVVTDGYDAGNIRIIDSAEPNPAFAVKLVDKKYITPQFFIEAGTALELPLDVVANLTKEVSLLQKVVALFKQLLNIK